LFNNFNDAGTLVLSSKSDNLFIAAIIDPISVGIYAFYTRLSEMAQQLLPVRLFENVVQPLFFAVPSVHADEKVPRYFTLLLNTSLLMQWPILAYSIAYHVEIVRVVFGGKFVEQAWLLPVVLGFATLNVIAIPVTLVAQYEEKAGIILLSKAFAIYNVMALVVLLPVIGIVGAVISSGSAQAMKNGFIWWHVRNRARWSNARQALISSVTLWGLVVLACNLIREAWVASAFANLLIGAAVVGMGFLAHVRGPAIAADDRVLLGDLMKGKEASFLRRVGLLR
jgi:O-antigen/teichoic acid export membrane protein